MRLNYIYNFENQHLKKKKELKKKEEKKKKKEKKIKKLIDLLPNIL
jgi:hypothetical protein